MNISLQHVLIGQKWVCDVFVDGENDRHIKKIHIKILFGSTIVKYFGVNTATGTGKLPKFKHLNKSFYILSDPS